MRSLRAPLDNLQSNWALMVMTSLAWNLKAWWALRLPVSPGRWQQWHRRERQQVVRMEFPTFTAAFMRIPCQILRSGRRLIYLILNWNPWQAAFLRLADVLQC